MNSKALSLGLGSAALVLWASIHRFLPLHGDAELYAFQALAKIHPALSSDIYLSYNSQDRYTIFSYIYAFFIANFGLQSAALGLFLACTVLSLCAAYFLARNLFGISIAWLAIGLLITIPGYYGAFEVFSYFEDYLTARSLAVALVCLALAFYMNGHRTIAVSIASLAMLVHPIMAFPGLLLLVCMTFPVRTSVAAAALSCGAVLACAYMTSRISALAQFLPLMEAEWLEVVQERSQFLFLYFWRTADWEMTARTFMTLALALVVTRDREVIKLCVMAMLVGISGVAVASIAGSVGPVAILVQGQAWRWIWVTTFIAVLVLAPTAVAAWRGSKIGPLSAFLLILGWVSHFSATVNLLLVETALVICLAKNFLDSTISRAFTLSVVKRRRQVLMLAISLMVSRMRGFFLHPPPHLRIVRNALMVALFTTTFLLANQSLIQPGRTTQKLDTSEFLDWQNRIPPRSNVLMVPLPINASFIWIGLNRPSYLSLNQSSGVVFAPTTAREIRRRSEVLLPIAEPDWKIRTRLIARDRDIFPTSITARKLTAESLAAICSDPQLGFVVAKEDVDYPHSQHKSPGPLQHWSLYDCKQVRPDVRHT